MAKVFISYRRTDSASTSGRIYDRLVGRFGKANIFKDVDDIPVGVRFPDYIQDSLRQCVVELVIIGRAWLTAQAEDGARRLDDARDWVRLEIEAGLTQDLTVIPVLVDGASMPTRASLPESLQALRDINAIEVRNDPDFGRDMDRLMAAVELKIVAKPKRTGPNWFRRPNPTSASAPLARQRAAEIALEPEAPRPISRSKPMPAVERTPAVQPEPRSTPPPVSAKRALLIAGAAIVLPVALYVSWAFALDHLTTLGEYFYPFSTLDYVTDFGEAFFYSPYWFWISVAMAFSPNAIAVALGFWLALQNFSQKGGGRALIGTLLLATLTVVILRFFTSEVLPGFVGGQWFCALRDCYPYPVPPQNFVVYRILARVLAYGVLYPLGAALWCGLGCWLASGFAQWPELGRLSSGKRAQQGTVFALVVTFLIYAMTAIAFALYLVPQLATTYNGPGIWFLVDGVEPVVVIFIPSLIILGIGSIPIWRLIRNQSR